MSSRCFSHITLGTQDVERTASFFQQAFGFPRDPVPANVPYESAWLNLGGGQQIHIVFVEGFQVSPFEREFGRHIALYQPLARFDALKTTLHELGAEIVEPLRTTPFERIFFREPVNGYFFEVIDDRRAGTD
jgi:catechol 2,3-dioxygenase-like lactoylglutathione lyase family enzyme